MEPDLTIVGAGLTGLTAAIEAAERGWHVVVAEAHSQPGGRARSLPAPFRANTGPHAIYIDGPWWAWLERRDLTPPIVTAPPGASLVMAGGQLGPWPAELSEAIAALPAGAPVQESFRSWLLRHVGTCAAEAIIGVVFIPTFDHDPGRLSAEFARERLRRALAGGARYVAGGWSTLAGLLAGRAASLGAQIRTQARVSAVPAGPAILATSLALAPPGHELIQITAACSPRERKADAERRVHRLLDQAWPGWRAAVRWQRSCVRTHCTGAIDLPGTTWRDRPAISRSHTLAVATDQSAAPGLLAEAAITAAQLAVQQLGQTVLASPSPDASLPRHRHAGRAMTTATLQPATMAGWAVTGELERAQPWRSGSW